MIRGASIRRYALGGLCIAVAAAVALVAWGAVQGDGAGRAAERDQPQRQGWSLRPAQLLDQRSHGLDETQRPERMSQVAADTETEHHASAGEPSEDALRVGIAAPITFYACYGPNGGYCASPAGPLPLDEGQAACGAAWPMGAVLVIERDPLGAVVCNDRGGLASHQVDRFFWREEDGWAWSAQVGSYARIRQVGTGTVEP